MRGSCVSISSSAIDGWWNRWLSSSWNRVYVLVTIVRWWKWEEKRRSLSFEVNGYCGMVRQRRSNSFRWCSKRVHRSLILRSLSHIAKPVPIGTNNFPECVHLFVSWRRDEQHRMRERERSGAWRPTRRFSLFELKEMECPWCGPTSPRCHRRSFQRVGEWCSRAWTFLSPIVYHRNWKQETNRSQWRTQTRLGLTQRRTSAVVPVCHGRSKKSWRLCRRRWRILGCCLQLLNRRIDLVRSNELMAHVAKIGHRWVSDNRLFH